MAVDIAHEAYQRAVLVDASEEKQEGSETAFSLWNDAQKGLAPF